MRRQDEMRRDARLHMEVREWREGLVATATVAAAAVACVPFTYHIVIYGRVVLGAWLCPIIELMRC